MGFLRTSSVILALVALSACVSTDSKNSQLTNSLYKNPTTDTTLIAPELLLSDIEQLVSMTIEIHPEAFSIVSKSDFLNQANAIKQSIQYPLTSKSFYLRIAPLIAKLKDIHSHITIPRKLSLNDDFKNDEKTSKPRLFPAAVLYENKALYVAADLTKDPQIPSGAVIVSINEMPIDFILSKMRMLTASETEAGLRRKIQIDFPWLLSVMGYARESYLIGYLWKNKKQTLLVEGIEPVARTLPEENIQSSELQDLQVSKQSDDSGTIVQSSSQSSFYGYSQLNDDTALLWFNDFYEEPTKFESFLRHRFDQFSEQKITKLIIDVRYNDGGLSKNIKTLLSFLTNQTISWSNRAEIKVSDPLRELHHAKTKQRRKNKYSWGIQWLPLEWTDYLQYEISWSGVGEIVSVVFDPIEPADITPPSSVVVLSNGFCYSACGTFVAVVNSNGLAQTIGEMAGSVASIQYVYPISAKLKNSHLELSLPTMKVYFDTDARNRRDIIIDSDDLIKPQIVVERTPEQIVARQDTTLSEALLALSIIDKDKIEAN